MDPAKPPVTALDGVLMRLAEKLFIMRDKAAKDLFRMVEAGGARLGVLFVELHLNVVLVFISELREEDYSIVENWIVKNSSAERPEARQGALMAAMVYCCEILHFLIGT